LAYDLEVIDYTEGLIRPSPVVDVALIHDELKLATFRTMYLKGLVHRHYFFTASHTHAGLERDSANKSIAKMAKNPRVEVIEIPIPPDVLNRGSRWAVEEYSRDWAMWFVSLKHPNDIMILADIDEIPSREQIMSLESLLQHKGRLSLPLRVSYRYGNWFSSERWDAPKAFYGRNARGGIRHLRTTHARGAKGAHLRYLGFESEDTEKKFKSFAHQEFDRPEVRLSVLLNLSNKARVSHLPSFRHRGIGFLDAVEVHELDELWAELASFWPSVIGEAKPLRETSARRLTASYIVHRTYHGKFSFLAGPPSERMQSVNPQASLLIAALALAAYEKSGIGRTLRVIGRLVKSGGTLNSARTMEHLVRGMYQFGMGTVGASNKFSHLDSSHNQGEK